MDKRAAPVACMRVCVGVSCTILQLEEQLCS